MKPLIAAALIPLTLGLGMKHSHPSYVVCYEDPKTGSCQGHPVVSPPQRLDMILTAQDSLADPWASCENSGSSQLRIVQVTVVRKGHNVSWDRFICIGVDY